MKKDFLILIFIFNSLLLFSQESKVKFNHQGKNFYELKHAWKAQWITHPVSSTLDYGVFNFRRTFSLENVPEKYIIYVSADNRYRLYVNGKYVVFGPSLGDIDHYRYETIDITEYLKPGKNVIAAEVVNFGEYRRAAQQTFQTAFILQAENESPNINTGNGKWKVIKNNAYSCIPFTSDSLKSYYAAGPGEHVKSNLYPWGWQNINFDDSKWLKPKHGTVEFAVGRGFLYGSTWFLVPRQIPFLREDTVRFYKIRRVSNDINIGDFIEKGKSATIPPNTKVTILLDTKYHTTGFPELIISGGENSKIKITYAESLFLPDSLTHFWDGNILYYDRKGNRDEIKNKHILGYYDIIEPDGGENRFYKTLSQRTFRYVQFDIETGKEPLVINDYYNKTAEFPFDKKASFKSDDPQLSKIFNVSWRTIRNSSSDIFYDPYYEQLQYIGDTRIEALVSLYISGDDRLMRKAISQFDDSRLPLGLTQSRYPCYIVQVIPPYSLLWIDMIHDYFMYRNDDAFIKQFIPGIKNVLDWFARKVDSTGMATNLEWWNFTDWAVGFLNGIPPGADDGYSANINLQYVYALQNAMDIFRHFGYDYEYSKYEELKYKIQKSVLSRCYSDEKNMIAETPEKKIFSQHTNIWAILTNTVKVDEQPALMQKIISDTSLIQSTIYFKFYLFRALQKAGLANKYVEMLQPWKNMINNGMTTFGETDKNPRSECHGWSASPGFDFLHTLAGIYPKEPGFKKVVIAPNLGYLKNIEVSFPHPSGMIVLKLHRKGKNKIEGTVVLPEGVTGEFLWNNRKTGLNKGTNKIKL